jgi:HD-GYP domain-containing protein (c-di-GMP phosphodiesterase class II)
MIFKQINSLQPGDVVYENVYDEKRRLIIAGDTVLTEQHITSLKRMGFNGVLIKSKFFKDVEINKLISDELTHKSVSDLKNLNVNFTINNAKKIVEDILSKKDLSIDYIDIRNAGNELFQHSLFVTEAAVVIGISLGFNTVQLTELAVAALLHDVGKMFSNPKIMAKIANPGTQEIEKYEEEKSPLYGFRLLSNESDYNIGPKVKMAILAHNLNVNGTGTTGNPKYDKLLSTNIPPYAKIIHVVDVYDMIKHDPIHGSPIEAVEYLKGNCGTMFDQEIVMAFLNHIAIYPSGTPVILSNGWNGVVYGQNSGIPERPKIILEKGNMRINLLARFLHNVTVIGIDGGNEFNINDFENETIKKR